MAIRFLFRSFAVLTGVTVACVLAEAAIRLLDGFALWPPTLEVNVSATVPISGGEDQLASRYARSVELAPYVDAAWYGQDPPPIKPYPVMPWVQLRLKQPGSETRLFEFNRAFLHDRICRDVATSMFGTQEDFLYFEPVGSSIYPSYRHLRRLSAPGWFTTNSFGWRGPDLNPEKPARTIRVAFVGASTTVGAYAFPFSYPEFIGHWLNLWGEARGLSYKFEVINAARTGIDSHSIAAIVRDELVPFEPDLVLYYEGANQFWPPGSIGYRLGRLYPRPHVSGAHESHGSQVSAVALRVRRLIDSWRGADGSEPVKPMQWIRMPGVDEQSPDSRDPNLPVELPAIMADLDSIHETLSPSGSELVVLSFIWMVEDGLMLDLPRQLGLFNYLNQGYWPATYRTMRRLADIQNLVFRDFARRRDLPFIDLAARFPRDANLFADGIHLGYPGTRLQAWMVFQDLTRLIDDRIMTKKIPRPPTQPSGWRAVFDQPSPRTITRAEVVAGCGRSASS